MGILVPSLMSRLSLFNPFLKKTDSLTTQPKSWYVSNRGYETSNNAFFSYSHSEFNCKENSGKRDGNKRMRNLLPLTRSQWSSFHFYAGEGEVWNSDSLKVDLLVVGQQKLLHKLAFKPVLSFRSDLLRCNFNRKLTSKEWSFLRLGEQGLFLRSMLTKRKCHTHTPFRETIYR